MRLPARRAAWPNAGREGFSLTGLAEPIGVNPSSLNLRISTPHAVLHGPIAGIGGGISFEHLAPNETAVSRSVGPWFQPGDVSIGITPGGFTVGLRVSSTKDSAGLDDDAEAEAEAEAEK